MLRCIKGNEIYKSEMPFLDSVSLWLASSKSRHEMRNGVQAEYVGGDPRKQWSGTGEVRQEKERRQYSHVNEQVPVGNQGSVPLGTSRTLSKHTSELFLWMLVRAKHQAFPKRLWVMTSSKLLELPLSECSLSASSLALVGHLSQFTSFSPQCYCPYFTDEEIEA